MEFREYDIIFAGAGTTACVVAGRLSATDPSLKILIIERGQHTRDVPQIVQPCGFYENRDRHKDRFSYHVGKPSAHLDGRSIVVPCGRNVGGGSSINFMMYVRGAASDYDDWAAFGNEGWSFKELLPYIRKLETFPLTPDKTKTHGDMGPIKISSGGDCLNIGEQFLQVAKEYDQDRQVVDDNNDFVTANAYAPAYRYVDPATGKRSGAAFTYLYPHWHPENPNLTIMVGKCVKRVIVENGRVVGVEYVEDTPLSPGAHPEVVTVKCNKLVVVSAGAFGSPAILERSGIGGSPVLEQNNVPILIDLPGVGENYQDHYSAEWRYYGSDETKTMNDVWNDPEGPAKWLDEWRENGTGKISHNGVEALAKLRLTAAQLKSAPPALQERWKTFFQHQPDKPMGIIFPFSGSPPVGRPTSLERTRLLVAYDIFYPELSGSVHITSGEDVHSPLDFDPDFLTKDGDIAQLTLLYKLSRELIRRMPCYRGEVMTTHPAFPAGSAAACKEEDLPVLVGASDIVYSDADDEVIVDFHRGGVMAALHSLGTCAMKPRNQGGVVDPRLSVYGVEGLKVADLSICPANVGNNTYSTALLIGEKAAAIIAEDLGYEIV